MHRVPNEVRKTLKRETPPPVLRRLPDSRHAGNRRECVIQFGSKVAIKTIRLFRVPVSDVDDLALSETANYQQCSHTR